MRSLQVTKKIKSVIIIMLFTIGNSFSADNQGISNPIHMVKEATFIPFQAVNNQEEILATFLETGANLVADTEPNTYYWYALRGENNAFGIIDFFPNEAGRTEHFEGQVAAALKNNAQKLVAKGWDDGIIPHIHNYEVLSHKLPNFRSEEATIATLIELKAQSGKEQELENLLTSAASIVAESEPKTIFWAALKLDNDNYAIFDTFVDESGKQEHFSGKVATALKAQANTLVEGGWEQGVLQNIKSFKIIAKSKYKKN